MILPCLMAHQISIILFLLSFLCFYSELTLLWVGGQLLPIVDEHGANGTEVKIYIVHVLKPNGTRFRSFSERRDWYNSFLPNTSLDSGLPRLIYAYRHVMSGFAARLTDEEVKVVESMEGFVLAHPQRQHVLHTTYTPQYLQLNTQIGGQDLWSSASFGAGKIIGVIDTGIDPDHPSFGDTDVPPPPPTWGGKCYWRNKCTNKLIGMQAFYQGLNPAPKDDDGHGTHVASTAAGNFVDNAEVLGQAMGRASGTAPLAHLSIYKVLFYFNGKSIGWDSDILAGIDWAIRDGVDILQMSLGSVNLDMYSSGVAIGSFAAMKVGIFPCAAAANQGPIIKMIANDAPWILTVGASSTDRRIIATVRLGDGTEVEGETAYQPENFTTGDLPIVYPGATINDNDGRGCNISLKPFNVKDKIVVCWKGVLESVEIGKRVKQAGGVAMILINAWYSGNTTSPDDHVLPASNIGYKDGKMIVSYINSTANPTASITLKGTTFNARPSPQVASFSSRGPSPNNFGIVKPDLIAPGENILAAWPKKVGPSPTGAYSQFKFLSGTSMATPHVSGIVALLKNLHPNWSPAMIKSALMTSSYREASDGYPIGDEYNGAVSAYVMGSGHVDPLAAANPGLVYDLHYYNYVHYLCGTGMSDYHVTAIIRAQAQCSAVNSIPAEQLNYPSFFLNVGTSSKTVTRTVTNVDEPDSEYQLQLDEPEGVRLDVSPTTLRFTQSGEKQSYSVTFSIKGAAQKSGITAEGQLSWISPAHVVRSPVVVTFI